MFRPAAGEDGAGGGPLWTEGHQRSHSGESRGTMDVCNVVFMCSVANLQEFIAVNQLNKSVQGKILCFTGPPGKTN